MRKSINPLVSFLHGYYSHLPGELLQSVADLPISYIRYGLSMSDLLEKKNRIRKKKTFEKQVFESISAFEIPWDSHKCCKHESHN